MMIKDETICIRCGLCAERCPAHTITMEAFETFDEADVPPELAEVNS
jgi:ferredoxin